ncbi:MAG: hypothetical protein ACXV8M_05615 [Candidatus Angelobacter sp.]
MGQDSLKELQDLKIVHTFYLGLLEKNLGHGVPLPVEIKNVTDARESAVALIADFKLWLDLLDLALTPPLVRDALKTIPGFETAHALLRYFTTKASQRPGDRDKTDCIITYLFRIPAQGDTPPAWHRPEVDSSYAFISQSALAFEADLYRALVDVPSEAMPPEHVTLLQEFEYFYQELEEFRHFDQIIDSGIVQRVRELKLSLGKSFYHPDSLATLAVWNDVFGRKFDELFHDAAMQIKTFAETVQKEGGSLLSKVEGDITVKNLSEVETTQILSEDYQSAQDEFRKVSRYKKAVDSRRPVRMSPAGAARQPARPAESAPAPRPTIPQANTVTQRSPMAFASSQAPNATGSTGNAGRSLGAEVLAVAPSQAVHNAVQEGKIQSARQIIKEHVRDSDPKLAHVFPVKNSKITLSSAEVESFKADYQSEKSFRADYASVMMTIVAYLSRMVIEVDEYNHKASSAYLWKPHADALGYLVSTLERLSMEAEQVIAVARARGLAEKADSLSASLDKLREYGKTVAQTLQSANHPNS